MRKFWPGHGWFDGKITKIDIVQSTVEADGRAVTAFQVAYAADGTSEDLEDDEISQLLPVGNSTKSESIVASLQKGFDYLENRLNGRRSALRLPSHVRALQARAGA